MGFNVEGARQAGYSDPEIAAHLAQDQGFDLNGARAAGYQDAEIIGELAPSGSLTWSQRIGEKLATLGDPRSPAPSAVMTPEQAIHAGRVAPRVPGEIAQMLGATTTDWLASLRSALSDIEAGIAHNQSEQFFRAGLVDQSTRKLSQELRLRGLSNEQAATARAAREGQQEALPRDVGLIERAIVHGLSSAGVSLPATLIGGPVVGAATLAAGTGLSRRREVLDAGGSEAEALGSGLALGALEGLTEFGPGKALFAAAKGSLPLYKELLKFVATELPGENITSIAQIVDDYRLGLRDEVTTQDFLDAVRDTTAATIAGGGGQLSVGGLMRAARARANRKAEERIKEILRGGPARDATPPAPPPAADSAGPAPSAVEAAQTSEPPYIPPGVQPGDVRTPEGPDVIRQTMPPVSSAPAGQKFGQTERLFEKPAVQVTEVDPTPFRTAADALKYAMDNLRGVVRNRDTGWDIEVGRRGVGKATSQSGRKGSVHWRAIRGLPQLLDRAVLVESHPDRQSKGFIAVHRLYAPMRMGDKLYRVKLTVREDGQGHHFYDHAHSEIERADVQSEGSQKDVAGTATAGVASAALGPSAQSISIADLLAGQARDTDGQPFALETRVPESPPAAARQQPTTEPDIEASHSPVRENAPGAAYVGMYQATGAPAAPTPFTLGGSTQPLSPPAEPIRREHIMAEFQRAFGVKVYQGKPFEGRRALGFHRPRTGEVRIKKHNDLEVTAHEVFHWLEREYPTLRALYHQPKFHAELTSISYDAKKIAEGFAEFGRLFMTKETEAVAKAPDFYDAFAAEIRALGIEQKLARVQFQMHQWYLQGAEARALSKVGAKPPGIRQRIDAIAEGWRDRALQSIFDRMHSIKVVEREITGTVGSVYESARLLAGARNIANQFLNYGTLLWGANGDLEFSGEGLAQIFAPVGEYLDDAMAYFAGRRAAELSTYGKENLFSEDEIQALLQKGLQSPKAAEIKTAFYKYQEYTKRLMDFAEQSGIVSAESRAAWEAMYQNYVPFYRVAESRGAETFGAQSGKRAAASVFKRLTGGTANLNDILDNITLNTSLVVHASLKNMAKRQLFRKIESSRKGARFAVRVPAAKKVVNVQMMQVEHTLRKLVDEARE